MRTIETYIEIAAPPERVWQVLTDFPGYPEWNPFIASITGQPRIGDKLRVRIKPPGKGAMTFTPTVLAAEPSRELRWKGSVLIKGLFDGEHYFRLVPSSQGTRFEHGEKFTGFLVRLLGGAFEATERGFNLMNEQLKRRAEA